MTKAEGLFVRHLGFSLVILAALAACGEREEIIAGERLTIEGIADPEIVNRADPIALPPQLINANWTHVSGNNSHRIAHPALGASLSQAWSVNIGPGNGRRHRLTADPVVSDGRIYTMDSQSGVAAFSTRGGTPLWARNLTPAADDPKDSSSGGLAIGGGSLFATTGFGELTAMNATSGAIQWVQSFDSAASGAPTYADGVVYVVTRNSIGWALDATTGRILWQALGATSPSGINGGAAPVIAGEQVVFPLTSGQLIAANIATGDQTWAASVAGQRPGRAFSRFSDLSADPVVANGAVFVGNNSGRAGAFNAANGQRIWRVNQGAISPMAIAGGSVFLVTDENRFMRLDAETGEPIWSSDLPFFTNRNIRRREKTFVHFGPVLAGGRLILASDDGVLRQFDPVSGRLIGAVNLPDGAARNPVVAGGTLYIVTENGQLHAFR
ncbi:PQQ-like beta-propeller repeat protein [Rhodobacteraceae bacterium]|nr:PQQ-like beta-propeller repeat protein [Paracoccaceae bacterium]